MVTFRDADLHPLELNRAYAHQGGAITFVITKITSRSYTALFEGINHTEVIKPGYNWLSPLSKLLTSEQVQKRIDGHKESISVLEKALKTQEVPLAQSHKGIVLGIDRGPWNK
ncbi:MAG: hypothetical protein Q7S06_00920 [Nanoarchaeota archaeon]|nr:hypothetical protein [Nanoarchaeota archaeon]